MGSNHTSHEGLRSEFQYFTMTIHPYLEPRILKFHDSQILQNFADRMSIYIREALISFNKLREIIHSKT